MSTHIMVDIETLGVDNAPPVLQIAAMEFDLDTGTVYETFNQAADITSLKNVSMDTLEWWLRTAPMVLSELSQKGEETEKELICNFVQWLNTKIDVFLWGNGILFDNRILNEKCAEYGLTYPVRYSNDMDMKTIIQVAAYKKGMNTQWEFRDSIPFEGNPHDAEADVKHQIKCVCAAYKLLTNN